MGGTVDAFVDVCDLIFLFQWVEYSPKGRINRYRALRAFHPMGADPFLLLFSSYLGVSWRKQSIGIALGYGWFAGVEVFAFMFYYGGAINHVAELLNTVAYSLTLIVWIAYVAFPRRIPCLISATGRIFRPSTAEHSRKFSIGSESAHIPTALTRTPSPL